jgi:hypothetical protein
MAAMACHRGMRSLEREARLVMPFDLAMGLPGVLVVAGEAVRAEFAEVAILVATDAALRIEDLDWAAIIVASQALRLGMSSF